jgi:hypothetical protein
VPASSGKCREGQAIDHLFTPESTARAREERLTGCEGINTAFPSLFTDLIGELQGCYGIFRPGLSHVPQVDLTIETPGEEGVGVLPAKITHG